MQIGQLRYEHRPLPELALIYRAMHGDDAAQRQVTLGEAEAYKTAGTFEEFLDINRLPRYEEEIR